MFRWLIDKLSLYVTSVQESRYEQKYRDLDYLYKQQQDKLVRMSSDLWLQNQVYDSLVNELNSTGLTLQDFVAKYNLALTLNKELSDDIIEGSQIIRDLVARLEYERVQNQRYLNDMIDGKKELPELAAARNFLNKGKDQTH